MCVLAHLPWWFHFLQKSELHGMHDSKDRWLLGWRLQFP